MANKSAFSSIVDVISTNWVSICVVAIVAFAFMKSLDQKQETINALKDAQAVYASNYIALQNSMADLRSEIIENHKAMEGHYARLNLNVSLASAKINGLESMIAREHVAIKKPVLVTKKAQAAMKTQEEYLACITGNISFCQ